MVLFKFEHGGLSDMERWIEYREGSYPDGFPKTKFEHESCGSVVDTTYPFCPHCGKKITHVRILKDGFEDITTRIYRDKGFVCE